MINAYSFIMEKFLSDENIKFVKRISKSGSVYYHLRGLKYPYILRISDHNVPLERHFARSPDFNIVSYKDITPTQKSIMFHKNKHSRKD